MRTETHEQAVKRGTKSKASGSIFEKRVRLDLEIGFICHSCGNVTKHKESTIRELLECGEDSDIIKRLDRLES